LKILPKRRLAVDAAGHRLVGGDASPQYPTKAERRKYAPLRAELPLTFLSRIFGRPARERAALRPLYDAIVAEARRPAWYHAGVPDTIDGRFDMLATSLAIVLLRLEQEGDAAKRESVLLTEIFIDDMDGSLRQLGIGDLVVGKRVGKIMGALGGRLAAFRDAFAGSGDLGAAVRRNIFRDAAPSDAAVVSVAGGLEAFRARLASPPLSDVLAGEIG
jgi:cytochrome b pre-mRNA-processing protein 3